MAGRAGAAFQFNGVSQPEVAYKANAIRTTARGVRHVSFPDGQRIEVSYPYYILRGARPRRPRRCAWSARALQLRVQRWPQAVGAARQASWRRRCRAGTSSAWRALSTTRTGSAARRAPRCSRRPTAGAGGGSGRHCPPCRSTRCARRRRCFGAPPRPAAVQRTRGRARVGNGAHAPGAAGRGGGPCGRPGLRAGGRGAGGVRAAGGQQPPAAAAQRGAARQHLPLPQHRRGAGGAQQQHAGARARAGGGGAGRVAPPAPPGAHGASGLHGSAASGA